MIPTTLVLFGATGDLAQKKIWKSLLDLHKKNMLPDNFSIVGFSRRDWEDADLHEFISEHLGISKDDIEDFLQKITYFKGDIFDRKSYGELATFLFDRDNLNKSCSNKMFFLAVPPDSYESIFQSLSGSGLSTPCAKAKDGSGIHEVPGTWTRILVEKPFGSDIESAQELDKTLGALFEEDQIFRIDHYLAKDTVQNILNFRFQNNVFENIWNREHIERIEIKMHEAIDINRRGAFYDDIGALRDVGQNHILQMMALVTMEKPKELNEVGIRKSRLDVLMQTKSTGEYLKAQYEGYREAEGVENNSKTETFFSMGLSIDNERWSGVPINIEAGKALPEKKTEIKIYFKDSKNILTFYIQPKEGIGLTLMTKKAGFDSSAESRELELPFVGGDSKSPDAYEKVLYDAIVGDRTIFTQTREVEAQWNIVMPILNRWKDEVPQVYAKGTFPNKKAL